MNEKWKQFQSTLGDIWCISKKEYLLTMAVCVLGGLVTGMLLSPRKNQILGSLNGTGNLTGCECEECEEE